MRKRKPVFKETEGSARSWLWVQLGPVEGTWLSLSVNDKGCLVCPAASSPRKEDIMSMTNYDLSLCTGRVERY
jgi:hypothetical protein